MVKSEREKATTIVKEKGSLGNRKKRNECSRMRDVGKFRWVGWQKKAEACVQAKARRVGYVW